MKRTMTFLLIAMTSGIMMNGCGGIAAMVVNPNGDEHMVDYNTSKTNQAILKKISEKGYRINLGDFKDQSESEKTITCRLATSVHPPKDESYILYIQHAFEKEFEHAKLYEKKSTVTITAELNELYGSTTYGDAYWSFDITLVSSNGEKLRVRSRYDYESSITAAYACKEMHKTFPLALQKLIHDTISDKRFELLLQKRKK